MLFGARWTLSTARTHKHISLFATFVSQEAPLRASYFLAIRGRPFSSRDKSDQEQESFTLSHIRAL
jgi:hypothetical protein